MSETRDPSILHRAWHTPMRDLVRGRMSERLDWRGVIADAPIPDHARQLLRQLVRRTRLWRLEKADVARDLVAHVQDALDDGRALDDILESFGDWRAVARLTRRAVKRKRPIAWHAWRWMFWTGVVLLVWYVGMGIYYFSGSRNIAVDYTAVMNKEAAAVAEADRAWPGVRGAMLAMGYTQPLPEPQAGTADVRKLIADKARPGDADWPAVSAFLTEHQQPIADLRAAAGMPGLGYVAGYYTDPADLPLFEPGKSLAEHERETALLQEQFAEEPPMVWLVTLPHLSSLRSAARLLSVDAFHALDAGDSETAHADLVALLRLADHADEQNILINQLVAISIRKLAFETLSEAMATRPDAFSRDQLADLAHRIAAVRTYTPDFTGEHAFMLDLIQHLYTDDGAGNGHLDTRAWKRYAANLSGNTAHFLLDGIEPGLAPRALQTALSPAAAMIVADRKAMTAMADRLYTLYEADMAEPMWRDPESVAEAELIDLVEGSLWQKARYFPITIAMPALGAVRKTAERYAAYADGTLVALALELYRHEHGGYPDTLDALVPRYLPETPVDRITGGALNYRLRDGRPVLYSLGADRDDDAGAIAYDAEGDRTRDVIMWVTDQNDPPIDGDWVVWPLHDEP